jgi:spermidine synthase
MRVRSNSAMMLIFIIGFCAIPAQVILMRELLMVLGGNELYIGIFLAVWMLLTAAGSYLAGFLNLREESFPFYTLILVVLPLLLLYLPDISRNFLLEPGVEPGLFTELILTFILLIPFCLLSGFLFSGISEKMIKAKNTMLPGKIYAIESAGSMAGGLLYSFVLVYLFDSFRAEGIITITGCILIFWNRNRGKSKKALGPALLAVLLLSMLTIGFGNSFARKFLFPGQTLIESRDTPYGTHSITRTGQQTNVFENNTLLFSTDNQQSAEESIHFVISQQDAPENVLLISGGITGLTNEILKYLSVDTIDYIEIDPLIFEIGKQYTHALESSRINLVSVDPRIFLRNVKRKYDVIIAFLPPPSSFYINRYYTIEFLSLVKSRLNSTGVFSFSLPLTSNYLNEGTVEMYSSLYKTSLALFRYIHIFPGSKTYFVASDDMLNLNISQLLEDKFIPTDYVNFYYMDEQDRERRSQSITGQLDSNAEINADFRPVAVSAFNKYWLNRFRLSIGLYRIAVVTILVLIFVVMMLISPLQAGMFAAGFSASSMQLVLILAFQVLFGYIFKTIGLFAAVFMMGLSVGAILPENLKRDLKSLSAWQLRKNNQIHMQLFLAVIAFAIPGFLIIAQAISGWPNLLFMLFLILTLAISVSTGITFSVLSENQAVTHLGNIRHIYGADLAGASLGALATSILFIPAAGIKMATCLAACLNIMVIFNILFRQKMAGRKAKNNIFEG